jgi:hypothetical protein
MARMGTPIEGPTMNLTAPFRIEWDLHELGPKPPAAYQHVAPQPDFSRLDYARAVAAGYVPANRQRFDDADRDAA